MAAPFQDSIVLFGDSLTQSWAEGSLANRLAEAYMRKLDVLNRGFGGYNSEWGRPVFEQIFARRGEERAHAPDVRLVTIWFGANDAVLPHVRQHVPLDRYIANLSHYVAQLALPTSPFYLPGANILLLTPPPIVPSQRRRVEEAYPPEQRYAGRDKEVTRGYRDAVVRLGEEWRAREEEGAGGGGPKPRDDARVRVVDTWTALVDAAGGEDDALLPYFTDGLHLTKAGYGVVFSAVMRVLRSEFAGRGLDPEDQADLPLTVPHHADVDAADPASSMRRTRKVRDEL